jgi:hypothetical protein
MSIINSGAEYSSEEVPNCKQRQLELSRQMTRLIDVLYALVLVQGAVYYRSLFTLADRFSFSHLERWVPVLLALALVYFTAIQSFIDYHFASEDQPYQLLDSRYRAKDLGRFYCDVVIVGVYSFVLLKCHVLLATADADLTPVLWAFVLIFLLYLIWGHLRKETSGRSGQPYSPTLLWLAVGTYAAIAILYTVFATGWGANAFALGLALLVMLVYRALNWKQTDHCPQAALDAPPTPSTDREQTAKKITKAS